MLEAEHSVDTTDVGKIIFRSGDVMQLAHHRGPRGPCTDHRLPAGSYYDPAGKPSALYGDRDGG